ncbi:MAG: BppU family phage baseplate upper protein [Lachnospira sp.]
MAIMNTQSIKVPIDSTPPFEYIIAKQGEISSRQVEVTLLQNNAVYTIPSGVTARVNYYKPDGNKIINDCTISNNKVIVTYTQQMLAAAGTGFAEIQLYKDNSVLISATFYTKITESVNGAGVTSDNESTSFTKLLVETTQARDSTQAARTATEKATDNANTATGNANTATSNAKSAASAANKAATAANNAASAADTAKKQPTKQPQTQRGKQKTRKTPRAQQTAAGNANTATTNANNAANAATAAAKTAQDAAAAVYTDRNYNLLVGSDGAVTFMYNEQ